MKWIILGATLVTLMATGVQSQPKSDDHHSVVTGLVGIGEAKCAEFLGAYRADEKLTKHIYGAWMQGFLSGYLGAGLAPEIEQKVKPGRKINMLPDSFNYDAQIRFLVTECVRRPDAWFFEPVLMVALELIRIWRRN